MVVAIGLALVLSLGILRSYILADDIGGGGALFVAVRQDLVLATTLTAVFLCLGWLYPKIWKPAAYTFFTMALVFVLWGAANIEFVRMLGGPLTLGWLRYSDFMSKDAETSLASYATLPNILLLLLIVAGFCVSVYGFRGAIRQMSAAFNRRLPATFVVLAAALPFLVFGAGSPNNEDARTLNPVIALVQSALFSHRPHLSNVGQAGGDVRKMQQIAEPQFKLLPPSDQRRQEVKNVVFFVLESTPPEYVQNYGGKYEVTPTLLSYAGRSFRFEDTYANVPGTAYSLFALITSLISKVDESSMTAKYPAVPFTSIGNVLSENGYRTAFFSSSDLRYQSSDLFLRNKGFDVVQDYRERACETAVYRSSSEEWPHADFSNDLCTAKSLVNWINADRTKPFFAMLWTNMTHHPYFAEEPEKKYVQDPHLNRYLNALRTGDEALGILMRDLEEKGLARSTLVVVFGDHGEAFGRHMTLGHASAIYEENVRIPLLMINEALFSGDSSAILGEIADIAPTVLDILQLPVPSTWQGRSLFGSARPQRVFFFAPWHDYQLGYREGNRKHIYRGNKNKMEIYDLSVDPHEKHNLAPGDPQAAAQAKETLTTWFNSQNEYIDSLLAPSRPNASAVSVSQKSATTSAGSFKIAFQASGTKYLESPKAELLVDGAIVGHFVVESAPDNSKRAAREDEINDAFAPFEFVVDHCPQKIQLRFLNDNWAGDGKTGDTNLYFRELRVNDVNIPPEAIHIEDPEVGSVFGEGDFIAFARDGVISIEVDAKAVCG